MKMQDLGASYTLNIKGKLWTIEEPQVMGILNVTPDSFYAASRCSDEEAIASRARQIVAEGGTMIDVGAYSSRPDAADVSAEEEMERLSKALPIIKNEAPDAIISVDTFRANVSRLCVEQLGADIINDISGGTIDADMFQTVADLHVPYILMHMRGTPQTMQQMTHYDNFYNEVMLYFSEKVQQLHLLGVNDIIMDPGFGFAKTMEQNYELFSRLSEFSMFDHPLLVGISRKSMIYKLLGTDASQALNGTTVLNTLAVRAGADILRVHDVRQAVETIRICSMIK